MGRRVEGVDFFEKDGSAHRLLGGPDVKMHYPHGVELVQLVNDVSRWSTLNFVLDPNLNRPVQIFAPRPLSRELAFDLFVASLETVGLRVVEYPGGLVKIVAHLAREFRV